MMQLITNIKQDQSLSFVVDNRKLTEAFIEVANELRRANGVTQDLALDEAYIKHAEERSNEMATTGVLSHDTKFTHPDGEDVRVENIGMKYGNSWNRWWTKLCGS